MCLKQQGQLSDYVRSVLLGLWPKRCRTSSNLGGLGGGGLYQQLQLLKWPHEADSKVKTTCFYKNLYILVQLWFGVLNIFNYNNCNTDVLKVRLTLYGIPLNGDMLSCKNISKFLRFSPLWQPQEHCQHAYEVIVTKVWGKRRKKSLGGQRGKGATNNLWLLWDTEISLEVVTHFISSE